MTTSRRTIEDIKSKKVDMEKKPPSSLFHFNNTNNERKETEPKIFEPLIKYNEQNREKNISSLRRLSRDPHLPTKKIQLRKLFFFVFFISTILGIIYWGTLYFEKASVSIVKKNEVYKLEKEALIASKGLNSAIPFEIMIISEEIMVDLTLSKNEEVSLKAQGEVTLYNEYSKSNEKLTANTFFSDENGKVYVLDKSVSIPGYTLQDNKIIPGHVDASFTSFLPGESYNGKPIDFTVNAYNKTPKFKKIYGKAKTEFSGGALGLNYSLEDKDVQNLSNIADTTLKDNLIKKVDSLIPPEYIFYKDANNFTYKINENTLSSVADAKVGIWGTLSVVLLKEDELKKAIIKNKIPTITLDEINAININGMDDLIFEFTKDNPPIEKTLESISFSLLGQLDFIWNPNIKELKNNLKGVPKNNVSPVFDKDVGIGNASIKIFPPWQKNIPLDETKIDIEVL